MAKSKPEESQKQNEQLKKEAETLKAQAMAAGAASNEAQATIDEVQRSLVELRAKELQAIRTSLVAMQEGKTSGKREVLKAEIDEIRKAVKANLDTLAAVTRQMAEAEKKAGILSTQVTTLRSLRSTRLAHRYFGPGLRRYATDSRDNAERESLKSFVSAPFDFTFTPSDEGNAELLATAKDAADTSYQSDPVKVTVMSKAPPPPQAWTPSTSAGPTLAFWTVLAYSGGTLSDCNAAAAEVKAAGLETHVLRTDERDGFRPIFYVAYSGAFSSKSDAQTRLAEIKARGLSKGGDTYMRYSGNPVGD